MYSVFKIQFILLAAILLSGCRSAKPTDVYEVSADSLSVSVNTSLAVRMDSISISEESMNRIKETVEFVERGGWISVSSDGSVIISGVANMKSSKQHTSALMSDSQTFTLLSQSKDSITAVHTKDFISQSRATGSSGKAGIKLIIGVVLIILMMIITAFVKIKTNRLN